MKICFIAPSEYGKNTAVEILKKKYRVINIKIARPLYKLQKYFYDFIDAKMLGEQDGELLQYFGKKIRQENKDFLLNEFYKELQCYNGFDGIITNDDCRPPDYEFLKSLGFIFIKINGFKRDRIDHTKSNPNSSLEWQHSLPCDYVVDNLGTIKEYELNLKNVLYQIIKKENENEKEICF